MSGELRLYEVIDETAVFVMTFDKELKKEWEKCYRELKREVLQKEIVGFVAVDDRKK